MNTIYYRGYVINTADYAGFWGVYKNQTFLTLSTQAKAIQWVDLQVDHFNERVFIKKLA